MITIQTAQDVASWTGLGIKLPKDLAAAVELFELIRWTEVEHPFEFELDTLTEGNIEANINEYATYLVLKDRQHDALSPVLRAKNVFLEKAARKVSALAGPAVPNIIAQLEKDFQKHAKAYQAAVLQLPEQLSADALVSAGAEAVTAYVDAQREVKPLERIARWVTSTTTLPGHHAQVDQWLTILRPVNASQLNAIDVAETNAQNARHGNGNETLMAINPTLVAAVRHGVEFAINTPQEGVAYRLSAKANTRKTA